MPIRQYQRYLIFIIPAILVGLLIYYFSDIFTYFALGWVLSLLGAPLFKLINKVMNRQISAVITLVVIVITMSLFMWLLIPRIVQQTRNIANIDYEAVMNNLDEPLQDWNNWMVEKGFVHPEVTIPQKNMTNINNSQSQYDIVKVDTSHGTHIEVYIDLGSDKKIEKEGKINFDNTHSLVDSVKDKFLTFFDPSKIPALFGSVAGFFGNLLITILSSLFIAFFFLKESGLFTRIFKSVIADDKEDQVDHAIEDSERLLARYFIGIAIQITVITIILSIVLGVLGFENALLIAFLAGLVNVIPYIGPFLGAMFGIAITLSSNMDASFYGEILPDIYKLLAVFAGMQLLDNFILQPNIFSKSVKAHPLEIFVIILIGAKLGGVMGMILAIPAYTIIRVIAKVFLSEFKIVQSLTRGI
ncbi:MAG: AI-2E family transporter [Saprospiraceae bacterium]|nr:AI-2E family transporter [Saprospiraceae bacterium]|tara:strand:- start:970 stop:2214 length:1245 start_codon:yes stop_codon:yes gene_type:complete